MTLNDKLAFCERCEQYRSVYFQDFMADEGDVCEYHSELIERIENCSRWNEQEVKATCVACEKNLYKGDTVWGNNQIGTFCGECAEENIATWLRINSDTVAWNLLQSALKGGWYREISSVNFNDERAVLSAIKEYFDEIRN
jgi:hypothetical protein